MIHNGVVKNAGWIVAGKIVQMLINLVVGLLTARYLGPSNFGLIGYANAYTTFFTCICTLGINSIIVKEFFDHPGEEGKILGTSLGLRAVSSLFSAFLIMGISSFMDAGEPETKLVVALCSISLVFNIFELLNYWFQSRLQSKKTAIAALIAYTVSAIYKVVLLIMGKSVVYFAFATSVDHLCVAAILLFFYIKDGGAKFSFSLQYGKDLLNKSHHYILSGMMIAMYAQTDKIMLKHMVDETAIGYYATALSLSTVWCFLLSAIITSMVPVIMQAHKENKKRFCVLNISMYQIVFYLSAIVSLGFILLGDWVVELLYGEAYLPAVQPLKIITWQTAFSYLGVARDTWILCENKQKYLKYIYISAAFANVVLNFLLIPIWGTAGAAIASLAAQIVTVMVAPFFIKEMRENAMMMLDAILLRGIIK
jgi:O-antigen/teichoic acid export membrane protein